MARLRAQAYHWGFYVAAGFIYAGSLLRAPLTIGPLGPLAPALILLLCWLAFFLAELLVLPRSRPWSVGYLTVQALVVVGLLLLPGSYDFFALLFGPLAMQAMLRLGARPGAVTIAVFVPLIAVTLYLGWTPSETAAFVLIYTVLNVILGLYALTTRRAAEARARNHALAGRLEVANQELRAYSTRLEKLAIARERNRVARELHDSVTQTIFSMNLSSQSALLLEGQPERVGAQLDRVSELAHSALAEMHTLINELAPETAGHGGLSQALRHEVERRRKDGLEISLTVAEPPVGGASALTGAEEQDLLRIAQEALNNVSKHSGAGAAAVHLRLWAPLRLEVSDAGKGFLRERTARSEMGAGMGLASMRERAAEIGWRLEVESAPGQGTRVMVTKAGGAAEPSEEKRRDADREAEHE